MYEFLAMRIHEGYLAWEAIKAKRFFEKVKDAYAKMYPDEKLEILKDSGSDAVIVEK